jgi:hypothetical protein
LKFSFWSTFTTSLCVLPTQIRTRKGSWSFTRTKFPLLRSLNGGVCENRLQVLRFTIRTNDQGLRVFRVRQQGPKHLALGCSWCHWKGLET